MIAHARGTGRVVEGLPVRRTWRSRAYGETGRPSPTLPVPPPIASCVATNLGDTSGMAKHRSFTDSIRAAILTAPYSRYALAKRVGVSQGTLADFVNGRHGIGSELLDRIAAELGLRLVVADTRRRRPLKSKKVRR